MDNDKKIQDIIVINTAQDLYYLSSALETAVNMDFMARQHGAEVWKSFLSKSGFDVPRK